MKAKPIKKIVVVGGGTSGWMSAAMLAKSFEKTMEIELIESDAISTVGVGEATIPPIRSFNGYLGIDEMDFLKATKGSIKLAIEFQNWGQKGDSYLHGFGYVGRKIGITPFHVYWQKCLKEGKAKDLSSYSFNNIAAQANKFAPVTKIKNTPLDGLSWAFHFDAGLYAKFLRHYSEDKGVVRTEGKIVAVHQDSESGCVTSVELENGTKIEADLFIDCSGFRALLINGALNSGYEDWSKWLPCDRAYAVPCSNDNSPYRPYTQSIAHSAGWQWRIPLQHRTGNGHVYASAFMTDETAAEILMNNLEGEALKDPMQLKFTAGKRSKIWDKNVISIGLASGFIEPLESTSIHLVQMGITNLVMHFPSSQDCSLNARDYNNRMDFEYERIRDFIILHYHVTERDDSEFWNYVRTMDVPHSLQQRIESFKHNGFVYREDNELFTGEGWLQVMVGQGIIPNYHNPIADQVTVEESAEYLQNLNVIMERAAQQLPTHKQFLNSL
ncbi:tryptophan 7-halogenase [Temperatibacter marinus]|uniref:Tryptophan 7-halogenase n=1 Tax=Temperatibacter marinus TaxID=1456591 RepID=A0AA52EG81_9PROT|nr:tryptophan halogenase family protein [Temperatibacter marinus]WND03103.1 tryptophan 7-halogenase [Temperatibacter marinus]